MTTSGLLLVQQLRRSTGVRWRTQKGWLREGVKAGGVSAAANRNVGLPTYGVLYVGVRYPNASRNADYFGRKANAPVQPRLSI